MTSLSLFLILSISISLSFLIVYSRKKFFVNKNYFAAPNTTRVFAFLADMTVFNSLNFIFILSKFLLVPEYRPEFQAFADHVFHNAGRGLGEWFYLNQIKLFTIYCFYSLITEMSPLRATLMGSFFGLNIEVEEGRNVYLAILVRNILKPFSLVLFPVLMLLSYFNSDRKWLHDSISKTKVLRTL